jgi:hypothetical protein
MRRLYNTYFDIAYPGLFSGLLAASPRVRPFTVGGNGALEQWQIAIPSTVDASAVYKVSLNNAVVAQFTTDASPTQAELLAGLSAALLSSPMAGSYATITISGNNILLTAKWYGMSFTVSANTDTTNDLTVTKPTSTAVPANVPFGRFVGRGSSDKFGTARLITSSSDIVLGITVAVKDTERDGIGPNAKTEYRYPEVMDVCDRTEGCDGIWVETIDEAIGINDAPYIDVATGKVTKTTTSNINISAYSSFQSAQFTLSTGVKVILVSFNKP